MKRFYLLVVFLLAVTSARASHIVGGEFELIWISGNSYRLSLIYYFDIEHNPDRQPEVEEPRIQVSIFEKFSNIRIRNFILSFSSRTRVDYTQLACTSSEVITDKLIYSGIIQLSPIEFGNPAGYYIAWERCCRNYDIDNIYSEDPIEGTRFAGQTFYLEFPAVVKHGQPFINSSPRKFPPLRDFVCPGLPYYVDFAGIDDDGDSLSYSLITPLNTFSAIPVPNQDNLNPLGVPNPGPYPEVEWRPGFSLNNVIGAGNDIQISNDGLLTVTPVNPGLYVFAIKCEEFRDGEKIGTVIRDFQMLVVEEGGCPFPAYPSIVGRKVGTDPFVEKELSVTFNNTVPDDQRCIEISITDPSTLRADEDNRENITLKLVPLNFNKKELANISLSATSAVIKNGEAAVFQICFPRCPFIEDTPVMLGIIVSDDACPLPLTDTLIVTANLQLPDGFTRHTPVLNNSLTAFADKLELTRKIHGEPVVLDITGSDEDMEDNIVLRGRGIGFNASEYGAVFQNKEGFSELQSQFRWAINCQADITKKDTFEFLFTVVDSTNKCAYYRADSLILIVHVEPPDNEAPQLSVVSDQQNQPIENDSLTAILGTPIAVSFTALDTDIQPKDNLTLSLVEQSGNVTPAGFVFEPEPSGSPLQAAFTWNPDCRIFENGVYENNYRFRFVVNDNRCYHEKTDTVTIHMTIKDVNGSGKFIPPNVFTPNGDDKNPFFAMVKEDETTGELVSILPEDNCAGEFLNIRIYGRWGNLVYESTDRNFRWYGKDMPAGVYFYLITYSNKQFRGLVSIRL